MDDIFSLLSSSFLVIRIKQQKLASIKPNNNIKEVLAHNVMDEKQNLETSKCIAVHLLVDKEINHETESII